MNIDKAIELALETWYQPDSKLYRDPKHPTIKLAGECGELVDLYGKHLYKPRFDWMQCKHCRELEADHSKNSSFCPPWWRGKKVGKYTPILIDELGDIWYYLRILLWIYPVEPMEHDADKELDQILSSLMFNASSLLFDLIHFDDHNEAALSYVYGHFLALLNKLDIDLDDLTKSNYQKLHKGDNHGWKDAR